MADIYFEWMSLTSDSYWRLVRVTEINSKDRSALGLILSEYQTVAGDIGADSKGRDAALRNLRGEMRQMGHALYAGKVHDRELLEMRRGGP